jgi:hypothetical protein
LKVKKLHAADLNESKWKEWYEARPDISDEDLKYAKDLLEMEEAKRLKAMKKL